MPKEFSEWEYDTRKKLEGMNEREAKIYKKNIEKAKETREWAKKTKAVVYFIDEWYCTAVPKLIAHDAGFETPVKPRQYPKKWEIFVTYAFDRNGHKYNNEYLKNNGEFIDSYEKDTPPSKEYCKKAIQEWLENVE